MEFQLKNQLQHHIADLLWKAKDTNAVKDIIKVYGKDAEVVFHMMMASYYDQLDHTDIAEQVLTRIKNGT